MADPVDTKPIIPSPKTELRKLIKTTIASTVAFIIGFVCSSIGINETRTEILRDAAVEAVEQENIKPLKDAAEQVGKEIVVEKVKEKITVKVIVTTIGSKVKDTVLGWFKSAPKEEPVPATPQAYYYIQKTICIV